MTPTDNAKIAVIEATLNILSDRLIGTDGNGGELNSLSKRIGDLEKWRWLVVGMAAGVGFITGGAVRAFAESLMH